MPNAGTIIIIIVLLWAQQAGALSFLASPASTSTTTISYQGRLADSVGDPVNDTVGMTFRIYNVATDGSPLWTETYAGIPISDGLFHVLLGSTTPLPESLFAGNDTLYLGITVGADSEMTPREQLASAPWAMQAGTVSDRAIGGKQLATAGFGTSNAPLRNFVIRGPVTEPDLTDTAEVDGAVWDLSSIVGDSAEMVMLHTRVLDDVANSYFIAWPNGESGDSRVNAPYVRAFIANKSAHGILWVRCDDNQIIKYKVAAVGSSNNALSELNVTVIGWVEPAATP